MDAIDTQDIENAKELVQRYERLLSLLDQGHNVLELRTRDIYALQRAVRAAVEVAYAELAAAERRAAR